MVKCHNNNVAFNSVAMRILDTLQTLKKLLLLLWLLPQRYWTCWSWGRIHFFLMVNKYLNCLLLHVDKSILSCCAGTCHLLSTLLLMQMQLKLVLPFLLIGYKCIGEASTEMTLSRINDFVQSTISSLKRLGKCLKLCFSWMNLGPSSAY